FMVFILFITVTLSGVSVISINLLNESDSNQILEHMGRENASNINQMLTGTEHSVNNVYYYAYDQLEALFGKLFGLNFREEYLEKVSLLALSEAKGNAHISTVYYRLTEDVKEKPYGFFYQRNDSGEMTPVQISDLKEYAQDDIEHVGWYYMPKKAKEPIWIGPYYNANIEQRVISYVNPVYVYGRFAGVIGMDIDVNVLCDELKEITVYNTGSAIMFDIKENILYQKGDENGISNAQFGEKENALLEAMHKSIETGHSVQYNSDSGAMKLYACKLVNGMTLCITAPLNEINASSRNAVLWSVLLSILITITAAAVTYYLIKSFLDPLRELTEASKKLADGNFDVHMHYTKDDEVGQLSKTFELMSASLKKYYDHLHNLAYTDALTGLNNNAAFATTKEVIESEVKMNRAAFTIIVMDVNNLKLINDSIGHEMGDELLKHVTQCLRDVIIGFPLYRIGGDEFCSIINNCDPQDIIERLQAITAKRSKEDYDLFKCSYQIAAGAATYDKLEDNNFDDVFNRADHAMYENKKYLKEKENEEK
ncbi:MAG: diguanylate cyclase, partial [Firmicutes bacterium]|nr:diguanylate cyclase [Bacillota bacterium]